MDRAGLDHFVGYNFKIRLQVKLCCLILRGLSRYSTVHCTGYENQFINGKELNAFNNLKFSFEIAGLTIGITLPILSFHVAPRLII